MQWGNTLLASFPRKWHLGGRVLVPKNLSLFFLLNIRRIWTRFIYIYIYICFVCLRGRWSVGRDARVFSLFPTSLLVL